MSTENKSPTRDEIRERFFASRNFKSKVVNVFGMDVEIRQLSLGDSGKLFKGGREDVDIACDTLIKCAYKPGTTEKLFEETDRDGIMALPFDNWVKTVLDALGEMMGVVDQGESEKN